MKKIYDTLVFLLVIVVFILALLLVGVRLFGLEPYTVLSGSMEPRYHVGSVIYVEKVEPSKLSIGDALTFSHNGTVITHEIVDIIEAENPRDMFFVTQGLTNNVSDGQIPVSSVIGRPKFSIPYLGYVSSYLQQPAAVLGVCCIVVVLLVISFMFDIFAKVKKADNPSAPSDSCNDPCKSSDDNIENKKEKKQ